ncbi:hypothetical protein D9758_009802 [Tetrapyrgos nigripes]|uniref:Uncharacterized protein n=1 Tax=Tetrapyrgos nigripes TaxID=182062 RepID=A0A8H5GJV0_9AGAR|nr:hypothetical protein D9758_009802 [Tetrapyrgos nigripes]
MIINLQDLSKLLYLSIYLSVQAVLPASVPVNVNHSVSTWKEAAAAVIFLVQDVDLAGCVQKEFVQCASFKVHGPEGYIRESTRTDGNGRLGEPNKYKRHSNHEGIFEDLVIWTPIGKQAGVATVLACLAAQATAYFQITSPVTGTQWTNGETHAISWTKGKGDGISGFDVELARLGNDGLIFVARDVPCGKGSPAALNLNLIDIPPADDYFILFLNSTPGTIFATSNRFTILPSGASPSSPSSSPSSTSKSDPNANTSPNPSAPTVTISGTPDPTKAFVTTFAASNGSLRRLVDVKNLRGGWVGMGVVVVSMVGGAVWTAW